MGPKEPEMSKVQDLEFEDRLNNTSPYEDGLRKGSINDDKTSWTDDLLTYKPGYRSSTPTILNNEKISRVYIDTSVLLEKKQLAKAWSNKVSPHTKKSLLEKLMKGKSKKSLTFIENPHIENIDYSLIKNKIEKCSFYKNGLLFIYDGELKNLNPFICFSINAPETLNKGEKIKDKLFDTPFSIKSLQHLRLVLNHFDFKEEFEDMICNDDNIEKLSKYFNTHTDPSTAQDFVLPDRPELKDFENGCIDIYISIPEASKNTVIKFTLLNNKIVTKTFNRIKNNFSLVPTDGYTYGLPLNIVNGICKQRSTWINFIKVHNFMIKCRDVIKKNKIKEFLGKELGAMYLVNDYSKHSLLKYSFYERVLIILLGLIEDAPRQVLGSFKIFDNFLDLNFKDLNPKDKQRCLLKNTFDFIKSFKNLSLDDLFKIKEKFIEHGIKDGLEVSVFELGMLIYFTHEGTTNINGEQIDLDSLSIVDCIVKWRVSSFFEILNKGIEPDQVPLIIRDEKIINNHSLSTFILRTSHQVDFEKLNKKEDFVSKIDHDYINKINQEIQDKATKLWIPFNACTGATDDMHLSYVRMIERELYIEIFIHDSNERYMFEIFSKKTNDFMYLLINNSNLKNKEHKKFYEDIYIRLVSLIRDFKVLINRDITMHYSGYRQPYGSNTTKKRAFWLLPRVKYNRNPDEEQIKKERKFINEMSRFNGIRSAHFRKLPEGYKVSKLQQKLAKSYEKILGELPPDSTFVSQSLWGENGMKKREIEYRSKALSYIIYSSDRELSRVEQISNLSWAGFEEHCERYVSEKEWIVDKISNSDRGIDIRARKEFKDGSIKYLLAQCKHWNKPIPPGAIKEFKASCDDEKSEDEKVLIFMTSNKFSPGAREYAEKFNIELIDGDVLLK